jgi:hypothetical protein
MEVRTFQPADLYAIAIQQQQESVRDAMSTPGYGEALAAAGPAFTATQDGEIMACAGVITQWHGNARAWAILSQDAGRCMLSLTRQIARWLHFNNAGRVDCAVDCEFDEAVRWVELLGFAREGRMRAYTPERRDCFLYAQVV